MTRTEELALKFTDGSLSPAEASELDVLIQTPANRKCLMDLLGLHHDLSAGADNTQLSGSVMREVSNQMSCRISGQVGSMIERQKMRSVFYWRILPLAAAAALAVAAGFGWLFVSRTGSHETAGGAIVARVIEADSWNSAVSWQSPDEPGKLVKRRAKNGMVLRSGMRIETFAGRMTIEKIDDGTKVELAGSSVLAIADDGRPVLERGGLVASVTKQAPGVKFAVETPHSVVTVVGTVFSLEVDESRTLVSPTEGIVRILSKYSGMSVLARKGMQVNVPATGMIDPGLDAIRFIKSAVLSAEISTPSGIATDGKTLWISTMKSEIFAVDPETMEVRKRLELGTALAGVGEIAYADGFLWVGANYTDGGTVAKVSPEDGTVKAKLPLQRKAGSLEGEIGVAFGGGAVWVGTMNDGKYEVSKLDPVTGVVVERIQHGSGGGISKLFWLDGGLWRVEGLNACRMDLASGRDVAKVALQGGRGLVSATVIDGNRLWLRWSDPSRLVLQKEALFAEHAPRVAR